MTVKFKDGNGISDRELRVKAIAELEAVALVKQETENDKHWSCNSW